MRAGHNKDSTVMELWDVGKGQHVGSSGGAKEQLP